MYLYSIEVHGPVPENDTQTTCTNLINAIPSPLPSLQKCPNWEFGSSRCAMFFFYNLNAQTFLRSYLSFYIKNSSTNKKLFATILMKFIFGNISEHSNIKNIADKIFRFSLGQFFFSNFFSL